MANRYAVSVRRVVSSERTEAADIQLGITLTFIAGAINAGGFLAVGQYTSHMSGIFSAMADNLALGAFGLLAIGLGAFLPFIAGAACSAMLINWGRRRHRRSLYALPLTLEALLLLCFGVFGVSYHPRPEAGLMIVPFLTFIMGLQNATVTKISGARMRTTHVTGIVTDIGIELGKLLYWNRLPIEPERPAVMADRRKLCLLSSLLASFFAGGVIGALGFKYVGFLACVPLALLLLALVAPSLADDLRTRR
ncbi:YoaK family protein [Microvirga sp. 2MCAF38]|uniref:YoaK family protein n=1 Tax=Microvirga sp. 2MCAF38 TaxID=3232989 RepID=UPI003F94CCE9